MVLNGEQFGEHQPGDYRGEPNEPDPNTYNRYDDFLTDHRRYINSRASGRNYVDRDAALVRNADRDDTKASVVEAKEEYGEEQQVRKVQRQAVGQIKRALPPKRKVGLFGSAGRTKSMRGQGLGGSRRRGR